MGATMQAMDDSAANETPGEGTPALPGTMQAVTARAYGGAEVLATEEIDRPTPGDDQVLVRVAAAGLDRGVWHLMAGLPYLIRVMGFGLRRPKQPVLGADLAGTVVAVGADVTRFRPGDEVFGIGSGTFAEYALADEAKLAAKPADLSFEQAGALAISGLTALQAVRDHAQVTAGQHVLVIGASGGVGSYAVQIAKAMGATVTGMASTAKLDLVRDQGADHVLDYTRQTIDEGGRRYDAIIDIGGNRSLGTLRRALTPTGTLVIVGGEQGGKLIGGIDRQARAKALSPFVGQRLTTFISPERSEDLEALAELVAAGQLAPTVGRTYRLAEAGEALDDLEQGRVQGKVVIVP